MINITENEFKKFADFIKRNYGINLKKEKQTLLVTRLSTVLEQDDYKSFSDYYESLLKDNTGKLLETLVNRITTNHTFFMRENDHFNYFSKVVLPYLRNACIDKDLRVWSAGCSTGEEPYTLQMLIWDYLGSDKLFWNTDILATDLSTKVLEKAIEGIYSNDQIASIPSEWKSKYFKKLNNNNSQVLDKIRKEVIFRRFNLMDNKFPFRKKFHVIFCRNVMIYFDNETTNNLVNKFYDNLETGGYLFIGHSETLSNLNTGFKYVVPAVYRKI